jgi:hypothetical protein
MFGTVGFDAIHNKNNGLLQPYKSQPQVKALPL